MCTLQKNDAFMHYDSIAQIAKKKQKNDDVVTQVAKSAIVKYIGFLFR